MLDLVFGSQFKRDRRLCIKRGYDMKLLTAVVDNCVSLPPCQPRTGTTA